MKAPSNPPARILVGVFGLALLLASGIAIYRGKSPWFEVGIAVAGAYTVWETYLKLTGSSAFHTGWDGHIRYFLLGLCFALAGPIWVVGTLTRGESFHLSALLFVLLTPMGIVMIVAELRDFESWRAELERERFAENRKTLGT